MKTIFGIEWPIRPPEEVLYIAIFFIGILILMLIIRYLLKLRDHKIYEHQFFLFQLKRLGLSNLQIKLLNNIITLLRLSRPIILFRDPRLFEKSIGNLLSYLGTMNEYKDSMQLTGREIMITYTKLYHHKLIQRQHTELELIEKNLPVFITIDHGVCLGKIIYVTPNEIEVDIFHSSEKLFNIPEKAPLKVNFWRLSDAEYVFESTLTGIEGKKMIMAFPLEVQKAREFRHPYIEIDIPCTIKKIYPTGEFEDIPVEGFLFRLNDYEGIIKMPVKLEYNQDYALEFILYEFKCVIKVHAISEKTVELKSAFNYTVKFQEMSDAAKVVLKKYITDHL